MFLGQEPDFWVGIVGATLVKLLTAKERTVQKIILTALSAVLFGYFFWEPITSWLGLDVETFRVPVVIICTLTGEGIMRWVIESSNNPKTLLNYFFGGNSKGGKDGK